MLSAPGALSGGEQAAMKAEFRTGLRKTRCGHDQLDVLMAIDPDAVFALWHPEPHRDP
jgi:hypothetical protein